METNVKTHILPSPKSFPLRGQTALQPLSQFRFLQTTKQISILPSKAETDDTLSLILLGTFTHWVWSLATSIVMECPVSWKYIGHVFENSQPYYAYLVDWDARTVSLRKRLDRRSASTLQRTHRKMLMKTLFKHTIENVRYIDHHADQTCIYIPLRYHLYVITCISVVPKTRLT